MVPLVRGVYHLVEVFGGELLLCEVVDVGSCMSKVVGGSVCGVYHVCLFEGVFGGGVQGLSPDVFGVNGVVVEAQSVACPVPDDGAEGVMVDGVFFVFTSQGAVAVPLFPKTPPSAPSAEDGVPAREPNPGGHVFHDILEVVDATPGVDAWPPK